MKTRITLAIIPILVLAFAPLPEMRAGLVGALQAVAETVSPEVLSALAMTAISLAMTYVPTLAEWHAALSPTKKRLFWLGALALTTIGLLAYSCNFAGECLVAGSRSYFDTFVRVLVTGIVGAVAGDHYATKPRRIQRAAALAKAESLLPPAPKTGSQLDPRD